MSPPRVASPSAPFLFVTGGKGGVGKTTLAANLGVRLSREGIRPLLVDLDFGLANLNVLLGIRPRRTVEDLLVARCELAECTHAGPGGVDVVPGSSGSLTMGLADPVRPGRLLKLLGGCEHDLIVGDSPAGIGEDVLRFAACARRVLLVTTPEPPAVTDAYGVIKAIDAYAREQGVEVATPELFVNLATDAHEARLVAGNLRQVCERFLSRSPRFVGWMPRSRAVPASVLSREPFVLSDPGCPASRSVARLARRYAVLSASAAPLRRVKQ